MTTKSDSYAAEDPPSHQDEPHEGIHISPWPWVPAPPPVKVTLVPRATPAPVVRKEGGLLALAEPNSRAAILYEALEVVARAHGYRMVILTPEMGRNQNEQDFALVFRALRSPQEQLAAIQPRKAQDLQT